ncbi:sulfatase-like hydrolase/transferase [Thalassobellus sediminis]|uniref:sulfatase-like hydrolase/transferase n=1 Tax=Thalassobellus sediminis TaxID=3367753 RepID=UPI0037AF04D9
MFRFIYSTIIFLSILSCTKNNELEIDDSKLTESKAPNILLVIADDMGLDATPGYNIGSIKPNMPNLQSMINTGITFNNVWSNPTCTPTRATILTGKYGFRTNITAVGDILSTSEVSLQNYLDTNTNNAYSHAVIGKWHLSNNVTHPIDMGIDYYAGLLGGGVQSYYNWNLTENGQTITSTEYSTTKFTDLAINWVNNQTQPWFLWLAYNAPHTPFHLPPNNLHDQGSLPTDQTSIDNNPLPYYIAAIEAMDTELGRLIASMSTTERDNTIIIFIGDNGTPNQVAQGYNRRRVKGSIYQGGVNVPMVISGKNVTRTNQIENALINTTDLFATIADIAGSGTTEINDSKSFRSLFTNNEESIRNYAYAENDDISVRNLTHKYIYFDDGSEAFYNLNTDALEESNLLNSNLSNSDIAIKNELSSKLLEIRN